MAHFFTLFYSSKTLKKRAENLPLFSLSTPHNYDHLTATATAYILLHECRGRALLIKQLPQSHGTYTRIYKDSEDNRG